MMRRYFCYLVLSLCLIQAYGERYVGRVVDAAGQPVSYATVYVRENPVDGTATGSDGVFCLTTDMPSYSNVIVSFIGYEKQQILLANFWGGDTTTVVLREQPIALEETVVSAKASKQKNKRKQMEYLLHQVSQQMAIDFPKSPFMSRIVSDVRMDAEGQAWGMEQMIARVVNLPAAAANGSDSVQFHGEYCKRYFKPNLRMLADTLLASDVLEKAAKDHGEFRRMANAVDSGVAVHKALWEMGNICYDLNHHIDDVRHWTVDNENEGETVLTHTEKKNYLGIFKYEFRRHYILDSESLSVRRFSESLEMWVNIPFGYKLSSSQVRILNLLNMREQEIEKFRLTKAHARITLNTIYQWQDGHLYPLEKNLHTVALLNGTKKAEIPIDVKATQRVTNLQTTDVHPMRKSEMTRRLKREIVEIY